MTTDYAPGDTVTVQYRGDVDGLPFKLVRFNDDMTQAMLRGPRTGNWWVPVEYLRPYTA